MSESSQKSIRDAYDNCSYAPGYSGLLSQLSNTIGSFQADAKFLVDELPGILLTRLTETEAALANMKSKGNEKTQTTVTDLEKLVATRRSLYETIKAFVEKDDCPLKKANSSLSEIAEIVYQDKNDLALISAWETAQELIGQECDKIVNVSLTTDSNADLDTKATWFKGVFDKWEESFDEIADDVQALRQVLAKHGVETDLHNKIASYCDSIETSLAKFNVILTRGVVGDTSLLYVVESLYQLCQNCENRLSYAIGAVDALTQTTEGRTVLPAFVDLKSYLESYSGKWDKIKDSVQFIRKGKYEATLPVQEREKQLITELDEVTEFVNGLRSSVSGVIDEISLGKFTSAQAPTVTSLFDWVQYIQLWKRRSDPFRRSLRELLGLSQQSDELYIYNEFVDSIISQVIAIEQEIAEVANTSLKTDANNILKGVETELEKCDVTGDEDYSDLSKACGGLASNADDIYICIFACEDDPACQEDIDKIKENAGACGGTSTKAQTCTSDASSCCLTIDTFIEAALSIAGSVIGSLGSAADGATLFCTHGLKYHQGWSIIDGNVLITGNLFVLQNSTVALNSLVGVNHTVGGAQVVGLGSTVGLKVLAGVNVELQGGTTLRSHMHIGNLGYPTSPPFG